MSILEAIVDQKKVELAQLASSYSLSELKDLALAGEFAPRGFVAAALSTQFPAIIAEIKRASPSKGILCKDLDPLATALSYQRAGAACLSVLTDKEFFKGDLEYLAHIRRGGVSLPMLRKDFTIDELQIWEARLAGADAILLIAAILTDAKLESLLTEALEASLDVLVEVHTEQELERALRLFSNVKGLESRVLLGINNRDLHSFETKLEVTEILVSKIEDRLLPVVSESGLKSGADLKRLRGCGVNTFLIGESLIVTGDCEKALGELIYKARG